MTLPQLFAATFASRREEAALNWQGTTFTFGEVDLQATQMAAALHQRGLRSGNRLCVYLANSPAFISLFLAATRLGVIFVPMNILYRDRELGHILCDAQPAGVVASQGALPADTTNLWTLESLLAVRDAPVPSWPTLHGDTPAALVYTSGTTGLAKGAILTHNNFCVNAVNLVSAWCFTSQDRLLLALPLFHVHGLGNGLQCWLLSGCHLRLEERFQHERAAGWMLDYQPTVFFGVPTIYTRMVEWDAATAQMIGSQARLFVSGSAPLPATIFAEFQQRYGHAILERYGMSETLMNISNPYAGERRPGSIGFPLPGVSAKIVEGELWLRGSNLFAGYWNRSEATAAAHVDGWFRTGDMASISEDGYFTLTGRRGDLIIAGGFNIYPREIEELLNAQPGVKEAAVAGVPDARRGESVVAWIVPEADWREEEWRAACQQHLASFKTPRAFVRMDQLPRTALGKIQKHLLPRP
jgi:malonyl-CoA/methylmalonyl-CoA synthetase